MSVPLMPRQSTRLDLGEGAVLLFEPDFLANHEIDRLWNLLYPGDEACRANDYRDHVIGWNIDSVQRAGGVQSLEVRVTSLLGEREETTYAYSGKTMIAKRWPPLIGRVKDSVGEFVQSNFDIVLLNLYKSGASHVSWHADNEEGLVDGAPICSLSLGCTRVFELRSRRMAELARLQQELHVKKRQQALTREESVLAARHLPSDPQHNHRFELHSGDLIVMAGTIQKHWRHRVPKSDDTAPRINLTFRLTAQ